MRRLLTLACVAGLVACAGTSTVEQNARVPQGDAVAARDAIVRYTWSLLGVPYRWGGADPGGMDCSGLVFYVYGRAGLQVPRTTDEQLAASTPLDTGELQPGDLVFFDTGFWQTHVGIYLDDGQFIHAPGRGRTVTISSLHNAYWAGALIRGGSFIQ